MHRCPLRQESVLQRAVAHRLAGAGELLLVIDPVERRVQDARPPRRRQGGEIRPRASGVVGFEQVLHQTPLARGQLGLAPAEARQARRPPTDGGGLPGRGHGGAYRVGRRHQEVELRREVGTGPHCIEQRQHDEGAVPVDVVVADVVRPRLPEHAHQLARLVRGVGQVVFPEVAAFGVVILLHLQVVGHQAERGKPPARPRSE